VSHVPDSVALSNIHSMGLSGLRESIPSSSREWSASDDAAFRSSQQRLRTLWKTLTTRPNMGRVDRTIVVVPSISLEVPDHLFPVFPAYEERFLFFVLLLLRQPGSTGIYITSQPILPRVVDYYFQLAPELNTRICASAFSSYRPSMARPGRSPRRYSPVRG
jgi:hypothetical protein